MENTPCTVRHLTLIEIANGVHYSGKVNFEGVATEETQGQADATSEPGRYYFCSNCLRKFDGSETFEVCRRHLGTFPG